MPRKDYYQILEIDKNATNSQIKRSYKQLSLQLHPDKIGREQTEEEEKKLNNVLEAYEVLSKTTERKKYDLYIGKYEEVGENQELIDLDYAKKIKQFTEDYLQNVGIEEEEIIELNPNNDFLTKWKNKVDLIINKLSQKAIIDNTKSGLATDCDDFLCKVNYSLKKKQLISDFLEKINLKMKEEPLVKKEFLSSCYPLPTFSRREEGKREYRLNEKYSQINLQNFETIIREICANLEEKEEKTEEEALIDEFSELLKREIEKKRKEIISQSKKLTLLIKEKELAEIEKFVEADKEEDQALQKAVYENYLTEIETIMEEKPFLQAKKELEKLINDVFSLLRTH
ncbi:10787_t:CDS:1 [Paraglomus occultum]|uniref:10787_t:CDS:1 n=1 Tax=Paraglomus occultum TaxID=144539 RepID=A0A9N9AQQ0_9GLOM|nr:10787_t:CDS:1 [Paraglomus occultum]